MKIANSFVRSSSQKAKERKIERERGKVLGRCSVAVETDYPTPWRSSRLGSLGYKAQLTPSIIYSHLTSTLIVHYMYSNWVYLNFSMCICHPPFFVFFKHTWHLYSLLEHAQLTLYWLCTYTYINKRVLEIQTFPSSCTNPTHVHIFHPLYFACIQCPKKRSLYVANEPSTNSYKS